MHACRNYNIKLGVAADQPLRLVKFFIYSDPFPDSTWQSGNHSFSDLGVVISILWYALTRRQEHHLGSDLFDHFLDYFRNHIHIAHHPEFCILDRVEVTPFPNRNSHPRPSARVVVISLMAKRSGEVESHVRCCMNLCSGRDTLYRVNTWFVAYHDYVSILEEPSQSA